MAWVLVLALVALSAGGNTADTTRAVVRPDIPTVCHVAEVAEVIVAPVVVAKAPVISEEMDFSGIFDLAKEIRPSYLAVAVKYIKSARNSPQDILWTIANWDSREIKSAIPRKVYNELTGLMESLQGLPKEEIVRLINYIKNSNKNPLKLAQTFYNTG